MRSVNELYNSGRQPTYDEILQIERQSRELRNQAFAEIFAALFTKVKTLVKKVLHIDIDKKISGHTGASV